MSGVTKEKEVESEERKEEEQPLLSARTEESDHSNGQNTRGSIRRSGTYGGSVDTSQDLEQGGDFGCFGRCEKCGASASEKCSSCCRQCCHSCMCCDLKDLHAPRCCEDERVTGTKQRFHLNENGKIYRYDHELLLTFRVLLGWTGTIFSQRAVYIILPYVAFLALACFVACYVGIPHARKLDTGRFNDFVTYIKVFIAFMLGLFLNNAFKRWWSSVAYFKRFLVSIKQFMFTLHAIGIEQDVFKEIERLAICSSYILNEEVHSAQLCNRKQRIERWDKALTQLVDQGHLTKSERKDLVKQSQCLEGKSNLLGVMSTMLWIWVGETMGQLRGDPKVPPPMYVRLLFLCQDCMAQVELLKTNLIVQLPYTYVHMLCFMVHVANILLAISCGLSMGSAMAEVHSRIEHVESNMNEVEQTEQETGEYFFLLHAARAAGQNKYIAEAYEAFQVLGTQFISLMVQPLLYQSFLVIAHALCYPYGMGICHMPTENFIQQVHYELQVMSSGSKLHNKRLEHLRKDKSEGKT